MGTGHGASVCSGKRYPHGWLAHIGHIGLKSFQCQRAEAYLRLCSFPFALYPGISAAAFNIVNWFFTPFFADFPTLAAYLFAFQSNALILCIFCCILSIGFPQFTLYNDKEKRVHFLHFL